MTTKNKVYVITADVEGLSVNDAYKNKGELAVAIAQLATGNGEVHQHQYQDYSNPATHCVATLIECSEAFLEKVRRLPLFHSVQETTLPTIRCVDALQIEPPESCGSTCKPSSR